MLAAQAATQLHSRHPGEHQIQNNQSGWVEFIQRQCQPLLAGRGVCRDYAHLTVTLLRALEVPARLVAVYAPGLSPMDFHAVAEANLDGQWYVVDATTLAPRTSLVRIATGRDASDTAFLNVHHGYADLDELEVTAVADVLPNDDVRDLVTLG